MSENKDLKNQLWKDYVEKANSFANWFTSILISNFVYLIKLGKEGKLDRFGKGSLGLLAFSLLVMFFFKLIGVQAARTRHALVAEGKPPDNAFLKATETLRKQLFYLFLGSGMIAVLISGFILWINLTK